MKKQTKEKMAFWLIIAAMPLIATSDNLGLTLLVLGCISLLMVDNIKEALRRK